METLTNNSYRSGKLRGLGFGIILILIGGVLLGINFGYIPEAFKGIIFSWPSLIILVGILHMRRKHQIAWGSIWIIVGFFFLVPKIVRAFPASFPGIGENFAAVYWPLLLICAGLIFIVFKFLIPENEYVLFWKNKIHHHNRIHTKPGENFEKNSVFSGGEHIILDEQFKGGEVNSVFGGLTLDLRRTALPEGDTYLELNAVFGGVTLYIPGDWVVITQIDAVFGGFEDKRRILEPVDNTRRLIIKGSCVFGGGEIIG